VAAALAGADAARLVSRALTAPHPLLAAARTVHVIAAGKAAVPMTAAFLDQTAADVRAGLVVCPGEGERLFERLDVLPGAHPIPDERSIAAGRRALRLASDPGADCCVVLLSGGGSSMLAVPAAGLTLDVKQTTTRTLLRHDADIGEINCVRKHLSAIKGGRLASSSAVPMITYALSDVVGDDLSVIASGPTVPDPTTYADALRVLERVGAHGFPPAAVEHLRRGARGEVPETAKPGDLAPGRFHASVIGSGADAVAAARAAALRAGYHVIVLDTPVTGEARRAAAEHVAVLRRLAAHEARPCCVISAGETTVRVVGSGRGGRNQEFALACVEGLAQIGRPAVLASIGTDGADGPTDAAGAIADSTTARRARERGLDPMEYLDDNDAWTFFESLGDLVRTGVTGTNVGDLQVTVLAGTEGSGRTEAL
jgi:hydroxypyruvate reductase